MHSKLLPNLVVYSNNHLTHRFSVCSVLGREGSSLLQLVSANWTDWPGGWWIHFQCGWLTWPVSWSWHKCLLGLRAGGLIPLHMISPWAACLSHEMMTGYQEWTLQEIWSGSCQFLKRLNLKNWYIVTSGVFHWSGSHRV